MTAEALRAAIVAGYVTATIGTVVLALRRLSWREDSIVVSGQSVALAITVGLWWPLAWLIFVAVFVWHRARLLATTAYIWVVCRVRRGDCT